MGGIKNAAWVLLALALVALGVAGRYLDHAPNFTPAASIALFAGFAFPSRKAAVAVMLAIMLVSDSLLGFYEPLVMAAVYGTLLLPLAFRGWLRREGSDQARFGRVTVAAVASSLAFFAVTNLAVWREWYEASWSGLATCYINALPFLKYTMAGDLAWSFGLFGAYAAAMMAWRTPSVAALTPVPVRVERSR
jgi:hypothetical protein